MSRLARVKLKIERAKTHVRDLHDRVALFRKSNPDLLVREQDAQTGNYVFRVRRELPPEFSLIIGDAISNLRGALDHLVCRLIEANATDESVPDTEYALMPMVDKLPTGDEKRNFQKRIKGVSPNAESLIYSIQPYNAGYELLGVLRDLNNADKHSVLLVTAYGVQAFGFSGGNRDHPILQDPAVKAFIDDFLSQTKGVRGYDPDHRASVMAEAGAPFASIKWEGGPPPELDENLYLAFEVTLNEPQITHPEPVGELLAKLTSLVDSAVDLFASELK